MYQWSNKAQQNAIVVLTSQRDFWNSSNIFLLRCCIENYAFLSFIKPWRYSWPRFENVCLRPSWFSFSLLQHCQRRSECETCTVCISDRAGRPGTSFTNTNQAEGPDSHLPQRRPNICFFPATHQHRGINCQLLVLTSNPVIFEGKT